MICREFKNYYFKLKCWKPNGVTAGVTFYTSKRAILRAVYGDPYDQQATCLQVSVEN